MSFGRRLLVAVTLIAALGVPVVALAKAPVAISGNVTLTASGASGGNRLVVKLIERTSGGALIERAVTETALAENTAPPYRFTLPTIDNSIFSRAGSTFTIQASIALRKSIRFQDSKAYTPGSTAPVTIAIHPSTGNLPYTASGDGWLLLGLILASLAGLLAGWRWLRMRPLKRQLV
ncbi:MAG: hypothetical protein ABIV47_01455 [Roseiflexaceae bacterium]